MCCSWIAVCARTQMTSDLPSECALAIAIPLTKDGFLEQSESPTRDYARLFREQLSGLGVGELWEKYRSAVVEPAQRAMESAARSGVMVVADVSLFEWTRVIGARRVVSLVAHWSDAGITGVELADAVHRPAAIVATLPTGCDSTFDLRMCHSFVLGEALKRAAPKCHVVMNERAVTPSIQLPLYGGIIKLLATGRYDFGGAVYALTNELRRRLV